MRLLMENELHAVAGGTGVCVPAETSGNNIGGVTDSGGLGADLTNIYEGLVSVTSHIIERVANSFE